MKSGAILFLGFFGILFLSSSCNKENEVFDDPYAGAKPPLGIVFNNATMPSPAQGNSGTVVTFAATGLIPYKDKLVFMFNGETAEIVGITSSTITVKVPASASSGAASITVDNQVFFGPHFKVLGKISIDPYFKGIAGTDGVVNGYYQLTDGRLLLVGGFSTFNGIGSILAPINDIVLSSANYDIDRSFRFGEGSSGGSLQSITAISNQGNYIIGGNFFGFDQIKNNISNITRLRNNGAMDTMQIKTYTNKTINVPAFNGGFDRGVLKVFNFQDKILAVGSNFRYYTSRRYNQPASSLLRDTVIIDSVPVNQVAKLNNDGSLDKTYHYNTGENKGLEGGNGSIIHAFMQADGKLVLVGAFSKFDNVFAGHIVRLNANGTVDNTFKVGVGANGNISSITYNNTTGKFLVTGIFGTFNGQPAQGIVLLNSDGTTDNSFAAKDFDSGFPSYAQQLSNGIIVVGGTFKKYNNIKRLGLLFLNADGSLLPGYNTTGEFSGSFTNVVEGLNADGKITVTLLGSFSKFDDTIVKNVLRIVLEK